MQAVHEWRGCRRRKPALHELHQPQSDSFSQTWLTRASLLLRSNLQMDAWGQANNTEGKVRRLQLLSCLHLAAAGRDVY